MKRFNLLLLFVLTLCPIVWAQNTEVQNLGNNVARVCEETPTNDLSTLTQNISIRYEHNKAWPRWDYAENDKALALLTQVVQQLASDTSHTKAIVITTSASPVGSEEYNQHLALKRAEVLRDIITDMKGGKHIEIRLVSVGEDWKSFLSYVEQNYHNSNRNEVIEILRSDASNDDKESLLQALDNGKTWKLLVRQFMDTSRSAAAIHIVELKNLIKNPLQFATKKIVPITISDMSFNMMERPITHEKRNESQAETTISAPVVSDIRKPVAALRTNLLVPALNVGVEIPIGTNWSVAADYYFPWIWPKSDNKNCFEFLGWGIEGRYWFGKNRTIFDRLQGHSVAIYGYMGYYDFERNYHGHQGEFINVGADYTYAMAVGKKRSLHLEFSLGVGFIYSQARRYSVIPDHGVLISDKYTKHIRYFGPTKANISLVVPIFKRIKPNDKTRHSDE